jgi:hypothetical protein
MVAMAYWIAGGRSGLSKSFASGQNHMKRARRSSISATLSG